MASSASLSHRLVIAASAGALVLALGACSASETSGGSGAATPSTTSSPSSTSAAADPSAAVSEVHNAADVDFAQGMIAHHRGALEMAEVASTRAENPQLKDLAERVTASQGPEIDEMTSWLEAWGEEVPSGSGMGDMEGMAGDQGMGMMTDEDMDQLRSASGRSFDEMWLRGMIVHHEGAVDDSRTEITEGENPEAVALAKKIISDQEAEIAEMEQMLQG